MSAEQSLSSIASELRRIRLALERISPPPPREPKATSERQGRRVTVR